MRSGGTPRERHLKLVWAVLAIGQQLVRQRGGQRWPGVAPVGLSGVEPNYPVVVPEELEPLLEWFGHGFVVGVVVEGVVVLELAGVVVVVVEAAPDITVPRPRPSPRVLPATPTPNRNLLRVNAILCSFDYRRKRWRTNCPIPTLEHADIRPS
jgi:hypothetical protein